MKKESKNHRNGFLMKKSGLLLTQCKKNHKIVIGEKPPVSRELVSYSHWRKKIELRERKRK